MRLRLSKLYVVTFSVLLFHRDLDVDEGRRVSGVKIYIYLTCISKFLLTRNFTYQSVLFLYSFIIVLY